MSGKWSSLVASVALCTALLATVADADPVRTWGACSARPSEDPQFLGVWEYTLSLGWDLTGWEPHRLEQVALFLDLADCACSEEPAYFSFPFTEGTGQNQESQTTHYYYSGHFLAEGPVAFPDSGPTVAFMYVETDSQLNVRGTARLVFLSEAEPIPFSAFPEHLGIVAGGHVARGEVTGLLPSCDCGSTPAESGATWSLIKAIFR